VEKWVETVRSLRNQRRTLDEITEVMVARIESDEGSGPLPIYAQVSVRTSVMGIMNYLERDG
jgi:hypothetical protein